MVRFCGRFLALLLAVPILWLSSNDSAHGQKAPAPGQKSAAPKAVKPETAGQDEAGVREASKEYLAAILKNDRKAMADFWLPKGAYVDDEGQSFNAREMIEAAAERKDPPRPEVKVTSTTIRFLTPDAAVEDGTSESTPPGGKSPIKGQFSALWVRQNGKWKLDSLRETRGASASSPAEQLAELDPFAGQWSGQNGEISVQVTAQWNANKTYLRRDLAMTSKGKAIFGATQQVGWDPLRKQIRSWAFDNDGGYGEGLWSLEGTLWMVLARGVHADGKTSKATHIFRFVDRDKLVWRSIDASVAGRPSKDFEMTLTRGEKSAGSHETPEASAATSPAKPETPAEAAKRAAILSGEAWKRVDNEYKQWAAQQVIYTPQQMEANTAKLKSELQKLPIDELQQFIQELDGKMKMLLSKDVIEARAWLGQYLSIFTDGYRKKLIGDIPNFADMSSSQMRDEYMRLRAKIMARQREQASFDAGRTQMVNKALADDAAAQAAANQAAMQRSMGATDSIGAYQSQYSPRPDQHALPPQTSMSVGAFGGINYMLPGSSY